MGRHTNERVACGGSSAGGPPQAWRSYGPTFADRPCLITETTWGSRGWTVVLLVAWALADLPGRVVPGADEAAEACQL